MLQRAASNAYSWWWASHVRTKQSKWLDGDLEDMEHRIKCMLLLLGEEADSFAKKAEMYYRRRPEVISLVEEVYRAYRALAERYDHISGELHKANHTIATAFPDQVQYAMLEEEDDNMPKAFTPVNPGKIHKSTVEGLMERKKKKEGGLPGPKGGGSKLAAPISKENAKAEISRLQKAILVVQTEKEFIKSSYESGIAKYWDLEKQINDMQEKVCYFQDQFNESAVIEDDEARALMTATALKSCQDTIIKLQEQQTESTRQARVQSQRLKVSTEKLKGVCGKSLSDSVHSSDKDVRKDCGVESEDVYSMKQEMFELQTMIDKIKEHFEKDSNLSLGEVAEKIDELVNEAVDLELQVSSQSARVNRLCLENTELEKSLQSLEEEKAVLASGSGSLNDKLKQAEEELMRVNTLASSFYADESAVCSNFTKAISSFSDISEMLQSPVLEHRTDSGLMLANKEKAAAPIDTRPSGDYSDKPKAIKDPSIYPSTDSSEKLHSPNLNASNSKSSSGFNETKEKKPDDDYDACGDPNKRREAKVHESVSSMDNDMKSNGRQERSSLEKGSLVRLRHISSESLGDVDSEQEGIRKQDSSTSGDAIPNKAEDSKMRENSTLTSGNASEVGDQDGSMIKLQQLLINGLQDKEKVLLAEYTSILQNYKDAKRTLREVETKNQVRLHELTAVISELRCANAIKDEEIRSLREILSSSGDKDASRNGPHQRNLGTCSSDRKDSSRHGHRRTPSFSSTHQRKQSVSSISKLIRSNASLQGEGHESNDAATDSESISLDDLKVPNVVEMENTPPLEQKFRRDIDTLLEENLEFWMKFSTSLQRIQEFQTNHSELKSAIDGLTNDVKQEVNSGDTTKTHESSAMEKGLRALKTELQVWLEQNAMLKGELKGRCTSLCNIQEEIAAALEMDADVEVEGARFTSYQAAKFQGEVLNMQQENNRVANELQAGFDHVKGLQEEVEKALARLHKSVSLSSIGSSSGDSSNHSGRHAPSNSNPKVPLQSFLFPTKNKKPSLLAYVNPVLQKHQADIKFLAKLG